MPTSTMRDGVLTSSGAPVASTTTGTAATGAGGAAGGSRSPPVSSPLPGLSDSGSKPPRREPYRPFVASPTPSATNVTNTTASAPPAAAAAAASPAALFASSLSLDLQRRVALRSEAVARARADSGSGTGNAAASAPPSMAWTSFVSPRSFTGIGGGSGTLNGLAAHASGNAVSALPSHSSASSSLPGPSPLTSSASPAATTASPAAAGGPSAAAAQGARAAGSTRNGAGGGLSGRSPPPPPSANTASLPDATIQRVRAASSSSSSMKAAAAAAGVQHTRTGSLLHAISESAGADGGSTGLSASSLVPAPSRHAVTSSWTSDAAPASRTVGASAAAAVAPHSSTLSHTTQGYAGDAAASVYDLSIKSPHDSVGSPVLPCAAPSPTPLPPPPKWAPHLREVFKSALPTRTGRHAESSQRSMHAAFVHVLQRERVREVVARAWRLWVLHSTMHRSQRGRRVAAAAAAQKTAMAARSSFADAERRGGGGEDGSGTRRERRVTQSPFRPPSSAASASRCALPTWAPVGSSDSGAPCSLAVDSTRVAYMDPMALGGSGGGAGGRDDGGSDTDAVLPCASDDDDSSSEPVAAAALGDVNVRLPPRSPTLTSPRRSPSQSHLQQQQPPQRVRMPHARSYRKHTDGGVASCGAAQPGLSDGVPLPPPPPRAPTSSSVALAGRVSSAITPATSSATTPTGVASSSALRSSATPQLSASRSRSLGREASLGLPSNASFPTASAGASASSAGAGAALLRPLHMRSPPSHALPSPASPLRSSSTTKSLQNHQQQQQQVTSPLAASAASAAGGASGGVGVGGGVATGNGDGPHVFGSPFSTADATGAAAAAAAAAERRRSMVQHLLAGKSPRAVSPHPSGNTGGGSGRSPVYEASMSRPHSRTQSDAGMSTGNGGTSMLMRLHRPLSGSAAGAMSDAAEERSSSSLLFTPRSGAAGGGGGGGARGASGISAAVPSSAISGGGAVGTPLDFSACSSMSTPATQSMTALSLITTAPMLLSREVEMRCAMYAREERRRQRLQRDVSGAMDALMMAALHRRSTERGLHPSLRQSTTSSHGPGRGPFSKNNSSSGSDGNCDSDGDDNVVAAGELVDCAGGRVGPRGLGNACADFVSATQLSAAAVRARAATSTATSSSGRVAAWGRVSPIPGLVVSTAAAAAAPQQVGASRLRLRLQDTFVENSCGSLHGGTRASGVEDYDDWRSDVTDERAGSRVSFTAHSRDGCAGRGGGGAGDVGGVHGAVVDDEGVDTVTAASDRSARALAATRQWGAQVMESIVVNTTSTPTAADRSAGRGSA